MEIDQIIAENLKKLRQQQNLSLSELAKRTGLSKVMLSQLEKGGSNPTINNIWKITNALGVPYTALLEEEGDEVQVVHRNELLAQNSENNHYRLFCYYPAPKNGILNGSKWNWMAKAAMNPLATATKARNILLFSRACLP